MKTAWAIVKKHGLSLSEASKKAWASFRLKQCMKTGKVEFIFKKTDSTIRRAIGTLQVNWMSKGNKKANYLSVSFWDCENNAWKSYSVVNLFTK